MIRADTSVWIPFFNRPNSREKQVLDLLIDADEAALAGVVLAELLQGCRAAKDRDAIQQTMLALPYFEMTRATWVRAGEFSSTLLRRGITLPISDLIVGALALEYRCRVYTPDFHFEKIPGLSHFSP